jgi:hypothetical protein
MRTKKDIKIDNAVLSAMDLLENLPQEKPRHGFYQRLNYRIEHPEQKGNTQEISLFNRIIRFAVTPAMVAACIAFGIFIGLGTAEVKTDNYVDTLVETYGIGLPETPQIYNSESE